jgi:putative transposase
LPRLAPKPLHLGEEEKEQLRQLLNRHSTPQQIAIRANIVWLADEGRNHRQIMRDLDISLNIVGRRES